MDHVEVRKTVITALFADDMLAAALVLKGGNALHLVHGVGGRTSLDVDASSPIALDPAAIAERLHNSLAQRFARKDHQVFDFKFERRPAHPLNPRQAGYEARFKLASRDTVLRADGDHRKLQREAATVADDQSRVFRIQISEHEYCDGACEVMVDDFRVRAYSLTMIAVEKYRALCQQLPGYALRPRKAARARDFFDIFSILETGRVDLGSADAKVIFHSIFAAKDVPLGLLGELETQREFHRVDWPSVTDTVAENLRSFDYYFDYAVSRIPAL